MSYSFEFFILEIILSVLSRNWLVSIVLNGYFPSVSVEHTDFFPKILSDLWFENVSSIPVQFTLKPFR